MLKNVLWSFSAKDYADREEFNRAVAAYHDAIGPGEHRWQPAGLATAAPQLFICYEAWIRDKGDLAANERLLAAGSERENGLYNVEILALLRADDKKQGFSNLELLHKTHQQMRGKDLDHHHFFAGYSPFLEDIDGLPAYKVRCGG